MERDIVTSGALGHDVTDGSDDEVAGTSTGGKTSELDERGGGPGEEQDIEGRSKSLACIHRPYCKTY